MNILILSVGTRNKIVQYFKNELDGVGNVIATDMTDLAPAIYEADKYYIVPKITDPTYITTIIEICKKENIVGLLSLIDPELSLLAKHEKEFKAIGTNVIGSSYELCEMSLNKFQMYKWLINHSYKCAKSYIEIENFYEDLDNGRIEFPIFVKPVCGSASIANVIVNDRNKLEYLFENNDDLLIQEFLYGQEIGADVFVDMISGEVVSIFTKKKIKMRSGETDKAVSFIDEKLNDIIIQFVKDAGFRGQLDIDLFENDGVVYISEVNPRFGGGYPHAYESGINHMRLIVNNLQGKRNKSIIGEYLEGIYMMKYSEIYIKR